MLSIKENRINEAKRLHTMKGSRTAEEARQLYYANFWTCLDTLTVEDVQEEIKIIRTWHRIRKMRENNVILNNDWKPLADGKKWAIEYVEKEEQKEEKASIKLNDILKPYNVVLHRGGALPSICQITASGAIGWSLSAWDY